MIDSVNVTAALVGIVASASAVLFGLGRFRRQAKIEARDEAEHLAEMRGVIIGELRQQILATDKRVDELSARFERFREHTNILLRNVLADLVAVPPEVENAVQMISVHMMLSDQDEAPVPSEPAA